MCVLYVKRGSRLKKPDPRVYSLYLGTTPFAERERKLLTDKTGRTDDRFFFFLHEFLINSILKFHLSSSCTRLQWVTSVTTLHLNVTSCHYYLHDSYVVTSMCAGTENLWRYVLSGTRDSTRFLE